MSLIVGHGRENGEFGFHLLVDSHDRCYVAATVTVVGRRPHGYNRVLVEVILVTLVDQLVSSGDELQTIDMIELGCDLVTEEPAGATGTDSPRLYVFGIGPDQVAECSFVGNFLRAGNDPDLIDRPDLRAQTTMDAEKFSIDNGGEHQKVEHVAARFPDGCIAILLLAFFVESVDLRDLTGLVVAANKHDPVWVSAKRRHVSHRFGRRAKSSLLGLEAHQKGECFEAEVATIDEIAQKNESGLRRL